MSFTALFFFNGARTCGNRKKFLKEKTRSLVLQFENVKKFPKVIIFQ